MDVSIDDHRMQDQDHDSPLSYTVGDTPPPMIEGEALKHEHGHPRIPLARTLEHSLSHTQHSLNTLPLSQHSFSTLPSQLTHNILTHTLSTLPLNRQVYNVF